MSALERATLCCSRVLQYCLRDRQAVLHCVMCVIWTCLPSFLPPAPCPPVSFTSLYSFLLPFFLTFCLPLFFLSHHSFLSTTSPLFSYSSPLPYISFLFPFQLAILPSSLPPEYLSALFYFSPPLFSPFFPNPLFHHINHSNLTMLSALSLSSFLTIILFYCSVFFSLLTIHQGCQNSIQFNCYCMTSHFISSSLSFFLLILKTKMNKILFFQILIKHNDYTKVQYNHYE